MFFRPDMGDEGQLIRLAQSDLEAFAPLYESYFPRVYAYCLRRVENIQDAEDLTSQVFIQAVANLDNFRGGSFAAWLFRIARNAVINQMRDRKHEVSLEDGVFNMPIGPELIDGLLATEEQQRLRRLVAALPDEQRDLLALKLAGGLSAREVGAVLGKSAGAVRVQLHRIIKQLRELYFQEEGA